jgi:hypothetical protein
MRPQTIGRTLGIGLRVAGRIAGQRLAASAQPASTRAVAGTPSLTGNQGRTAGQAAGQASARAGRGLAQGMGGFLRPFRRVGGILWLEVTGVFFLLPAVVFAPTVWHTRLSYLHGPDHRTFWVSAIVVAVFLYLGVTSFLRARRK